MTRAARDVEAMMGRNEEPTKEDIFYESICVQAVSVLCDGLVMLALAKVKVKKTNTSRLFCQLGESCSAQAGIKSRTGGE